MSSADHLSSSSADESNTVEPNPGDSKSVEPISVDPTSIDMDLKVSPSELPLDNDPRSPLSSHIPGAREPHYPDPLQQKPPDPVRYSLRELMILITLAAALMAPIRLIGAPLYAAITGTLAFILLMLSSVARPKRGIFHVAWWILLIIYLTAAAAAVVGKHI